MNPLNKLRVLALVTAVMSLGVALQHGPGLGLVVLFAAAASLAPSAHTQCLGANSFAAALVTDVARIRGITILQAKLAALSCFSTDFSCDPIAPKKTIQVPKATVGATGQTNPTNYETGDTTLTAIAVTPNELSVSFGITSAQLQQGFRIEQICDINLRVLANMIMDAATTPMTLANFPSPLIVTAANFGTDDLSILFGNAKNYTQKNLVLDGTYLGQFIPTDKFHYALGEDGAYGFDKMRMNNRWNGGVANLQGIVADPQAIGLGSGLPVIDDAVASMMLSCEVIIVPGIDLPVQFCVWGSLATRGVWASYSVMFGAAAGDTTAARLITSA
ncbi:MAG: hypothetical protein JWL59_1343 [Chthoniobacteraceae bacterium]|nr:hypothetical protein [Chthoniobacteraceae bacterium]